MQQKNNLQICYSLSINKNTWGTDGWIKAYEDSRQSVRSLQHRLFKCLFWYKNDNSKLKVISSEKTTGREIKNSEKNCFLQEYSLGVESKSPLNLPIKRHKQTALLLHPQSSHPPNYFPPWPINRGNGKLLLLRTRVRGPVRISAAHLLGTQATFMLLAVTRSTLHTTATKKSKELSRKIRRCRHWGVRQYLLLKIILVKP